MMIKSFITLSLLFTAISTVNAQSLSRPGRFLSPFKNHPIVEMKTFGGYCHGRCPETKIKILSNGVVNATYTVFNRPVLNPDGSTGPEKEVKRVRLANLSRPLLKKLKQELKKYKVEKELKDTNPNGPRCSDSATTTYSIIHKGNVLNYGSKKKVKIAEDKSCKNFVREGREGYKIVQLIKSFRSSLNLLGF